MIVRRTRTARRRIDILLPRHEGADPLDRLAADPAAKAEAADQFSVIDGEAAEGRFSHADASTVACDLLQERFALQGLHSPITAMCRCCAYYDADKGQNQPTFRPLLKW